MVGDASELTPGGTTFGFSSQVLVSDPAPSQKARLCIGRSSIVRCVRNGDQSWNIFMFVVLLALVDQCIGKPVCWAVRSESSLRQLLS